MFSAAKLARTTTDDEMAYTEERLKRALEVFRASDPYRERRRLTGRNLENFLESRSKQYETRGGKSSIALRTTLPGIWNDKDESGDYTPSRKKVGTKAQKPLQHGSKRKRCDASGPGEKKAGKRNKMSYTSGRQKGLSLQVTFKFKGEDAKAKVTELFPPAAFNGEVHTGGALMGGDVMHHSDESSASLFPCNEGSLFPTLQDSAPMCGNSPVQSPRNGNPQVRSAASTGNTAGNEPAEHCLPRACTSDPIIIDDSEDSKTENGNLMDDNELPKLIRRTETLVRDAPAEHHLSRACTSDLIIIDDSEDSKTENGNLVDDHELPELTGRTKIIETNWAHPIDYCCDPESCNFCQDFRYSIFGCGTVKIEVIELEPGVYEEMGGGHREEGMTATKICLNCSLQRIAIARCPRHEILPIDDCVEDEVDYLSFLNQVATSPHPEQPTCSVCINPASYACGTKQKEDPGGLRMTDGDHNGCGLLLCGNCAGVVVNYSLDMKLLENNAESSKVLRADRDFLLPGSDLWQACVKYNG